jgi:hypothetical protein
MLSQGHTPQPASSTTPPGLQNAARNGFSISMDFCVGCSRLPV